MLDKLGLLFVLPLAGVHLSAPSGSEAAQVEGNPWWLWIVVFAILAGFVGFMLLWWLRSTDEEAEVAHMPAHVAVAAVPEPVQDENLEVVEGIGPTIGNVLRNAGIHTLAQLAATDVERLRQILSERDPQLLRLGDPATWPEQAQLAANGQWEALDALQKELKGGRRV